MQDYDHPSFKLISIGASGTGKTSLIWDSFFKRQARFKFIYDHKAMEFSRRYKIKPCFTVEDMMRVIEQGHGMICFSPAKMFPGEPERGFEVFCNFVFNISEHISGLKLFLCDELQRLVGTNAKPKPLLTICDIGRTYQIDCYFIASAANTIHNLVKGQITQVYCFKHKGDCEWEVSQGFSEDAIKQLKKGEWCWMDIDTGETKTGGKAFG